MVVLLPTLTFHDASDEVDSWRMGSEKYLPLPLQEITRYRWVSSFLKTEGTPKALFSHTLTPPINIAAHPKTE